jgi:beta-glucosidase
MIAPDTADYELGLTSRGTARLYLDGELLVENTSDTVTSKGASVQLRAGEPHNVRIEYSAVRFSRYQGGQVRLYWKHDDAVMAPAIRDAVADACAADAAIVVVRDYETEGGSRQADRPDLNLPKEQDQLIRRVARASPNTVVVLTTGGVTKISNWEEDVPAILQAWYPGQDRAPPSPTSFSATSTRPASCRSPSPTTRARSRRSTSISSPSIPRASSSATERSNSAETSRPTRSRTDCRTPPSATVISRSTMADAVSRKATSRSPSMCPSNLAGAEVAQVYIGWLPTRFVPTPPRQLAGVARVELAARAAQHVTVMIPRRSLSYWTPAPSTGSPRPGRSRCTSAAHPKTPRSPASSLFADINDRPSGGLYGLRTSGTST